MAGRAQRGCERDGMAQSHCQFAILASSLLFSSKDISHWFPSMCVFFAKTVSEVHNDPESTYIWHSIDAGCNKYVPYTVIYWKWVQSQKRDCM